MKCSICGKEITRQEFKLGSIVLMGDDYAHVDCVEAWLSGAGCHEYEEWEEME